MIDDAPVTTSDDGPLITRATTTTGAPRTGGALKRVIERLHADHAALASLLVPTPTRPLLRTIRQLLEEHNPIEEGEHGLYHACEQIAGSDLDAVVARMRAIAPVRMSPHVDEPRVHEHIARMLAARVVPRTT